jgi:hypothetical protein
MEAFMNKSKWFLVGMAVLVLAFGFVLAGCENGVQQVEGEVSVKHPQVAAPTITAEKTTDGKYLILRWDAVADGRGYEVYLNQEGKKTIDSLSGSGSGISGPTHSVTFKVDGTSAVNNDPDKWNVKIPLTAAFGAERPKVRFGVRAYGGAYDGREWDGSGIAWTDYYEPALNPYEELLGTWKKDGATAAEKQSFKFERGPNPDNPSIEYTIRDQSGELITGGGGTLSLSSLSGDIVSTSFYSSALYETVYIYIGTTHKLTVSGISNYSSYDYLNGTYVKQ